MAEFNQASFSGGMNLMVDDTRLAENEYREAFNVRSRFDVLESILTAKEVYAPEGLKQGLYTWGDYMLLFASGSAYYRHRTLTGWTHIEEFRMSAAAARYYLCAVPVTTTLNGRLLNPTTSSIVSPITAPNVSVGGTPAGIVVQDGVSQPSFIWVDNAGVHSRVLQKYEDWKYDGTGADDRREYVPIGTLMEWYDGILFVVSPDGNTIYRSVTGRPLDFVVNVDTNGNKGGDAITSAYSLGMPGITTMKATSSDGMFISTGNRSCYLLSTNRTPGAITLWGEPTFIRRYLFDAGCVSERAIIDVLGDLVFVDPEGLRSYNAILQLQNEGRNSIFSKKVAPLFKGMLQDATTASAIVYDNYALFAVRTIYGNVVLVYDTLTQAFVSIDEQTAGRGIKQFAKIDSNTTELYAITEDDMLLRLYSGTDYAVATCRLRSVCSQNPKMELQPSELRCVLSGFRMDSTVKCTAFVNNRQSSLPMTKRLVFGAAPDPYDQQPPFADIDSQVNNVMFNWTGANQGWKVFYLLRWTGGGAITNVQITANDISPLNPSLTQANQVAVIKTPRVVKSINAEDLADKLFVPTTAPSIPGGQIFADEEGQIFRDEDNNILLDDNIVAPTEHPVIADEEDRPIADEENQQIKND